MNRYPAVVYLGSAILGKVGAEMMLTDPFVVKTMNPPAVLIYAAEALAIASILAAGRSLSERERKARTAE